MLKVLELFSGIGSQTQALKNIGVEHISTQCEIDKYAINVYNQLHGETPNLGDISKVNPDDLVEGQWDLITYSSPCQDWSVAGLQRGGAKGSGTRSALLWECEKIIRKVKPKYLLLENVKNLVSKKFFTYFDGWLSLLEDLGYKNYWKVLNAKDYGIPQNRERVFCVSILGEHEPYVFPEKMPLTLRLKDMLETNVDPKYYLSDKIQETFKDIKIPLKEEDKEVSPNRLFNIYGEDRGTGYAGNVWDNNGLSPTLQTMQGGNRQPLIIDGNDYAIINDCYPGSREPRVFKNYSCALCASRFGLKVVEPVNTDEKQSVIAASRGRQNEKGEWVQQLEINKENISNTLTCVQKDNYVCEFKLPNGKTLELPKNIPDDDVLKIRQVRTELGKQLRRENKQNGLGDTMSRNKETVKFISESASVSNCLTATMGVEESVILEPEKNEKQELNGWQIFKKTLENLCKDDKNFVKETKENKTSYRFYQQALETLNNSEVEEGDVIDAFNKRVCKEGTSPTITTRPEGFKTAILPVVKTEGKQFRIRKLTPRECWRLMGWTDEQFDKIKGISNAQLYKQAGNSICVNCLEVIFRNIFLKD